MSIEVTLNLSEQIFKRAERFGEATKRHPEAVLADILDIVWPTLDDKDLAPMAQLENSEILALADTVMDPAQDQRLGELQKRGKTNGLTFAERHELTALLQIYQIGLLRKSEALAEAVQRGLRKPLSG